MIISRVMYLWIVFIGFLLKPVSASSPKGIVFLHASVPHACMQRCQLEITFHACNSVGASSQTPMSDAEYDLGSLEYPNGSLPAQVSPTMQQCEASKAFETATTEVLEDGTNIIDLSDVLSSQGHIDLHRGQSDEPWNQSNAAGTVQVTVSCPSESLNQSNGISDQEGLRSNPDPNGGTICQANPASQFVYMQRSRSESHLMSEQSSWAQRGWSYLLRDVQIQGLESPVTSSIDIAAFSELWVEISDVTPARPREQTPIPLEQPSNRGASDLAAACHQFFMHSPWNPPDPTVDMCAAVDDGFVASIPWLRVEPTTRSLCGVQVSETENKFSCTPEKPTPGILQLTLENDDREASVSPQSMCPSPQQEEMAFQRHYWAFRFALLAIWIWAVLNIRRRSLTASSFTW